MLEDNTRKPTRQNAFNANSYIIESVKTASCLPMTQAPTHPALHDRSRHQFITCRFFEFCAKLPFSAIHNLEIGLHLYVNVKQFLVTRNSKEILNSSVLCVCCYYSFIQCI